MLLLDIIELNPQMIVKLFALFHIEVGNDFAETIVVVIYGVSTVITILLAGWGFFKFSNKIMPYICRNNKWRNQYIKNGLQHSFGDYISQKEWDNYIPTMSQGTPPYDFDEPDEAVTASPKQDLVQMFIDEVFSPDNTNRQLYCILAGSGMGKTTFAVLLFVKYIKKYKKNTLPYQVYIKDMANSKILEEIDNLVSEIKIVEANKSILILDALDENLQAAEDFEKFRGELEQRIEAFKFVVITCRSQFFPDEQSELSVSGIRNNSRDKNLLKYNKVYICPFSQQDIKTYVEKKYPKTKDRKRIFSIIGKCRHLMARPLLLAYVDDLLNENQEFQNEASIYEVLINKWIEREVSVIGDIDQKEALRQELIRFSKLLAIYIYQNWRDTGVFVVSKSQLTDFCRQNHFDVAHYQFRGRSLINHDVAGSYKFSHKSFLEYFLAKEYFDNPSFKMSFEGMDMAELFYSGFCKQEYKDYLDRKIYQINTMKLDSIDEDIIITIAKKSQFDYSHLFYVINPGRFSEIEMVWAAYDKNVQELIEKSGVNSISILKYEKGKGSLRSILKAHHVSFISIEGGELPNSFVKEASAKGLHVFHNGSTIVSGTKPIDTLSLNMQLRRQMDTNTQLFRMSKMRESENRLRSMLLEESNE